MRCLREVARITAHLFFPSQANQRDQVSAMHAACRPFDAILDYLPDGECSADAQPTLPIFLLSAGWRSGSTLLQRLVCSDPSVLIWGEPYDRCHTTERLMDSLRPFGPRWPNETFFIDVKKEAGDLSEQWIANLYPPLESVRRAHRNFFLTLFSEPAELRGYRRWGFKEVRFGREQIHYLRWLFPGAKFVLLVRNPQDCWRSYRGKSWFSRWPDQPVRTARCFGRNWSRLALDFLHESEADDTCLVRYEDLGSEDTLNALGQHLGMYISSNAMDRRIGGGIKPAKPACRLAAMIEKVIIRNEAGPVASHFGYAI